MSFEPLYFPPATIFFNIYIWLPLQERRKKPSHYLNFFITRLHICQMATHNKWEKYGE
jgi:hypothetical protein